MNRQQQEGRLLTVYTIYCNPKDYPGKFVVRPHVVIAGKTLPKEVWYVGNSLANARESLPQGLHRLPRDCADPPSLLETWM